MTVNAVGPHRTPRHLYYFNGQGPFPGATTVTGVLDKPALTKWHREQVAQTAIRYADRLMADRDAGNAEAAVAFLLASRNEGTNSRERGTRVHAALEAILQRQPVAVEERDRPAVEGARLWLNEHGVKPIEVEAMLFNLTVGYGGTCDLIAQIDGKVWLLDWKTSKSVAWANGKVYDELRLQLAGYARAEFIAREGDGTRHPLPAIERFGILHVTDGGTRLYEADVTDADWRAFQSCVYLHQWKAGKAA